MMTRYSSRIPWFFTYGNHEIEFDQKAVSECLLRFSWMCVPFPWTCVSLRVLIFEGVGRVPVSLTKVFLLQTVDSVLLGKAAEV